MKRVDSVHAAIREVATRAAKRVEMRTYYSFVCNHVRYVSGDVRALELDLLHCYRSSLADLLSIITLKIAPAHPVLRA